MPVESVGRTLRRSSDQKAGTAFSNPDFIGPKLGVNQRQRENAGRPRTLLR